MNTMNKPKFQQQVPFIEDRSDKTNHYKSLIYQPAKAVVFAAVPFKDRTNYLNTPQWGQSDFQTLKTLKMKIYDFS